MCQEVEEDEVWEEIVRTPGDDVGGVIGVELFVLEVLEKESYTDYSIDGLPSLRLIHNIFVHEVEIMTHTPKKNEDLENHRKHKEEYNTECCSKSIHQRPRFLFLYIIVLIGI